MKKKILLLGVILFISLFAFPAPAVFSNGRISKAQKFIRANMIPQAIKVLEEEINENPDNAEAHFQLAIAYRHVDKNSRAIERFEAAHNFEPDKYGQKIAQVFKNEGDIYLKRGQPTRAMDSYRYSLRYNNALTSDIAKASYQKMLFYLNPELVKKMPCGKTADSIAVFIVSIDSSYQPSIVVEQKKYARACLDIATKLDKNHRQPYLEEANLFLEKGEIDKRFPKPSWKDICMAYEREIKKRFPKPYWKISFEKAFTGQGYGPGDIGKIPTVYTDKQVFKDDAIIIIGKEFQEEYNGQWVTRQGKIEFINTYTGPSDSYNYKVPLGQEIRVIVLHKNNNS